MDSEGILVVSESHSLAQLRAELARAAMAAKRTPCAETRATLDRLRREYAEAKLADYVAKVVAASPPLTDAQRTRLALLLKRGDGEPPGGPGRAAPGTQQNPAERRHRQRDGRTQGDRRNASAEGPESREQADQAEADQAAVGGDAA